MVAPADALGETKRMSSNEFSGNKHTADATTGVSITECKRCGNFFDYRRLSPGSPFRCSSCGEKHTLRELEFEAPKRIVERTRELLRKETRQSYQEKLIGAGVIKDGIDGGKKLYLIENDAGLVKIGVSESPEDRVHSIQTGSAGDVWLRSEYKLKKAGVVEKELHNRFADDNVSGEWFNLPEKIVEDLEKELSSRSQGALADTIAGEKETEQTTLI